MRVRLAATGVLFESEDRRVSPWACLAVVSRGRRGKLWQRGRWRIGCGRFVWLGDVAGYLTGDGRAFRVASRRPLLASR